MKFRLRHVVAAVAATVVLAIPSTAIAHHPVLSGEAICVDGAPKVRWTVSPDAVRSYTWSVNGAAAKPDNQAFTFTNSQTSFTATATWWNQQGTKVAGPETRNGGPVALRTDCTPPTTTGAPTSTTSTTTTQAPPASSTTVPASSTSAPTTSIVAPSTTSPAGTTTTLSPPTSATGAPTSTVAPSSSSTAEPDPVVPLPIVDIGTPPPAGTADPAAPATLPATGARMGEHSRSQLASAAIGVGCLGGFLLMFRRRAMR